MSAYLWPLHMTNLQSHSVEPTFTPHAKVGQTEKRAKQQTRVGLTRLDHCVDLRQLMD